MRRGRGIGRGIRGIIRGTREERKLKVGEERGKEEKKREGRGGEKVIGEKREERPSNHPSVGHLK